MALTRSHENPLTKMTYIMHVRGPVAVCSRDQTYSSMWKKKTLSEQQRMNVSVMSSGCTLIHAGMNTEVSALPCICPPTQPPTQPSPHSAGCCPGVVRESLPAGDCLSLRAESPLADGLHLQLDTHTHN